MKNKELVEEVPITSTDNAGVGLQEPKLPIDKKNNVLKRYKDMKKNSYQKLDNIK